MTDATTPEQPRTAAGGNATVKITGPQRKPTKPLPNWKPDRYGPWPTKANR